MGKDSTLYQLMVLRMNSVMNGIVSGDGEYQAILGKSDEVLRRAGKDGIVEGSPAADRPLRQRAERA